MKTIFYLAMTADVFYDCPEIPLGKAYMACHFSPYGPGLDNLPQTLPSDSMVILNDRIPYRGHDITLIANQLAALPCGCILLDFQDMDFDTAQTLCAEIIRSAAVPIAAAAKYAANLPCAVFLEAVEADRDPLLELSPWKGREIWLDVSPGIINYTITPKGSARSIGSIPAKQEFIHPEPDFHSRYTIQVLEDSAEFTLWRSMEDVESILHDGRKLGITKAVGLQQEWIGSQYFP